MVGHFIKRGSGLRADYWAFEYRQVVLSKRFWDDADEEVRFGAADMFSR